MNDIVALPLKNGGFTLVDACTQDIWGGVRWTERNGYVRRGVKPHGGKYRLIILHREVIGAKKGELVDHINHNTLDNRKANLRIATHFQNAGNRSLKRAKGESKYLGVSKYRDGRWRARLRRGHLGYFHSEEEAARVRDAAAIAEYGEFASLNFPGGRDE